MKQQLHTVQELMKGLQRLRDLEMKQSLPSNESRVLMFLTENAESEGKMVSDIHQVLNVSSPFVTQLLNKLEKKELIYRRIDPKDRRIVRIFLTDAGKKLALQVQNKLNQSFIQLVTYLGEKDSKQFADLIHKVADFIEFEKKTDEKKVVK
ncbi:MarR family winged helix-turn-helix transcriptional regulator [Bacillus changyiensis]|uniref:MarR family winged helix-turn-helix transcriptional regulator n=1 Tax=Bacillus changyiensis TaxID=3004103 RepID=UPI0022E3CC43|nr:MarR family transcriptional regulator [Bacillus changyiensis]MDA1475111.1 MarR family transcriptional regulator [Bacillus changyiensis]